MGNAVLNQVTPDGQTGPPRACVPYPEFEEGLLCGSGGKLIPPRSSLLGTRPAVKQSLLGLQPTYLVQVLDGELMVPPQLLDLSHSW